MRKAQKRIPPKGYIEKHHIFPVSIFGKNNNTVVLDAREHYIAHALLEKIYIKRYGISDLKTKKMICAIVSMSSWGKYKNSYLYENVKKRFSKSMQGKNNPFYGKKHTKETIEKIRENWKRKFYVGKKGI
jgi:hypothetical protein